MIKVINLIGKGIAAASAGWAAGSYFSNRNEKNVEQNSIRSKPLSNESLEGTSNNGAHHWPPAPLHNLFRYQVYDA
jgi:hypothetical protein